MAELTTKMRAAGAVIGDVIEQDIRPVFRPAEQDKYQITVICRHVENPNAFLIITRDDLAKVIEALQHSMTAPVVHEGHV